MGWGSIHGSWSLRGSARFLRAFSLSLSLGCRTQWTATNIWALRVSGTIKTTGSTCRTAQRESRYVASVARTPFQHHPFNGLNPCRGWTMTWETAPSGSLCFVAMRNLFFNSLRMKMHWKKMKKYVDFFFWFPSHMAARNYTLNWHLMEVYIMKPISVVFSDTFPKEQRPCLITSSDWRSCLVLWILCQVFFLFVPAYRM